MQYVQRSQRPERRPNEFKLLDHTETEEKEKERERLVIMTYEDLKNYLGMKAEVHAVIEEIEYWETYVITVKYDRDGGSSNHESNPTKQATDNLIMLREKLRNKRNELVQRTLDIEEWLDTLPDKELVAVIRNHFILGKTWRETTKKVYGFAAWSTSQMKVRDYFKKEKKNETN